MARSPILAAISDRREHGARGLARDRQPGDLSDPQQHRRKRPTTALAEYERRRLGPTTNVVLTNRKNPPDAILREVFLRTGDRPFHAIEDVISADELAALSNSYKRVAGFDQAALAAR